ncbi:MAG: tRNA pseudouridine(38-40) synthase TruA [Myxococcales bacterium]|nr:tRNA pseudouridine(38-40) synthase TruA [Myxococcales bacterium]
MTRYKILIEYDGRDLVGWQRQDNGFRVQQAIEEAIGKYSGEMVTLFGAGRTDSGVHALGQVAHFDAATRLGPAELGKALNAVLPPDVAARALHEVAPDFDARRDAISKRYVYRILLRPVASPLRRRWCWHIRGPLDLGAMREASDVLKGTHDFAAFRGAPGGPPADEETRRTLDLLHVERRADEVEIAAEARSFLRYMVRNLVGTLVDVGRDRLSPGALAELLASRQRSLAGPTAPAHGLCLEQIRYPD